MRLASLINTFQSIPALLSYQSVSNLSMASNGMALHESTSNYTQTSELSADSSTAQGQDWDKLAGEYAKMTHNTSLKPIGTMLERANAILPFSQATGILDSGCGPGPVMSRIIADYGSEIPKACLLLCTDFSEPMLKQVEQQKASAAKDSPWSRVEIKVQNAMDLTEVADGSRSHVTAGMVYFMTAEPMKCLTESRRVLKEGGVLSLSSWEGSQWMDLMLMLKHIRPEKQMPAIPDAWSHQEGLAGEMKAAGFKDVETHRVPCEMAFESHESLVHFFVHKMPHMIVMAKDMSEGEVKKLEDMMVAESKKMDPNAPGKLKGVALVAVGRK